MGSRLELQAILEAFCDNVYFQPPEAHKISYPCIVYRRDDVRTKYASNRPYNHTNRYQVTVIQRDPDYDIPNKVGALPMSSFDRSYTADNLNHDVYNLFF